MKTSALVALAVIALGSVDGAFLRQGEGVEPGANDFHGELEAASDNDSASQGASSCLGIPKNIWFVQDWVST